jgi:hypothetical protein
MVMHQSVPKVLTLQLEAVLEHLDGNLEEVVEALCLGLGRLPGGACRSA